MADTQHTESRPEGANHQQAEAPRDRGKATDARPFTLDDVASLVRFHEHTTDKLLALLTGIHSMLPKDKEGNCQCLNTGTLVEIAQDIAGDISYLRQYKDRIEALAGAQA